MKTVKLGDICEFQGGDQPPKSQFIYEYQEGYIRFLQIRDFGNNPIYCYIPINSNNRICRKDDILIARYGASVGKILTGLEGAYNVAMMKFTPIDENKLLKKYLYYFLKTNKFQNKLTVFKRRAAQAGFNKKQISEVEIPLPDLETQKAIADKLEKIENLIEQKKQVIQKTDELIKSTFIDMFGDPYLNPKGWESEKIKDVIYSAQYGTSKKATEDKGSSSIGVLRMNNITYNGDIDLTELKYVNFDNEKDYDKYTLEKGDILFNRTNSKELVGKTAVYNYDETLSFAGYLVRLKVNYNLVLPIYISSFLNSEYGKKVLYSMAKNIVGMANINAKEVQSIKLPIPPLELQQKFADIVSKIEQQKQQHQQSLEKLQELYNSTLQESFRF